MHLIWVFAGRRTCLKVFFILRPICPRNLELSCKSSKILKGLVNLPREATRTKLFYLPSEKWSTLNGKNLLPHPPPSPPPAPLGSNFIPFRVDPFSGLLAVQEHKQKASDFKVISIFKKWRKFYEMHPVTLKPYKVIKQKNHSRYITD